MSRTRKDYKPGSGRQRRISVRSVRRDPIDVRKLSRALVALARAQAEADAQAQKEQGRKDSPSPDRQAP